MSLMQADLCHLNIQILILSLTNNSVVSLTLKSNLIGLQSEVMIHPLTHTKAQTELKQNLQGVW